MTIRNILFVCLLIPHNYAWPAESEPNDSGIGGTGRSDVASELDVFEPPDAVDNLDILLPTEDLPGIPSGAEDFIDRIEAPGPATDQNGD